MKSTLEPDSFLGGGKTALQSPFEQPETGPFREPVLCTQFSRQLQKLFPLPSETSAPEHVRGLLQRIHELFADPHVSKAE